MEKKYIQPRTETTAANVTSALLNNSIDVDRTKTYNASDALGREQLWDDEYWDE